MTALHHLLQLFVLRKIAVRRLIGQIGLLIVLVMEETLLQRLPQNTENAQLQEVRQNVLIAQVIFYF